MICLFSSLISLGCCLLSLHTHTQYKMNKKIKKIDKEYHRLPSRQSMEKEIVVL